MTRLLALATGACIAAALCALVATAKADENQVEDLTKLPIEDLMNIQVTSAAKRPQKLSDATAAIYVITQEDIRRSGAETIPDVLRMVPGLEVAQIDSSTWAITARGSNSRFANKLLVLIDGRTVYSPLFSGVFWDQQDTLLEDIDRIEVIRGPGAALYGANAVNGVINIITKSAKDTQGGLVAVGSGTDEPGMGEARFGGKLGANAYFRAYTKFFDREEHRSVIDTNGHDGWRYGRAGFRADGQATGDDRWTTEGEIYKGYVGETFLTPSLSAPYSLPVQESFNSAGGHLLGRWEHSFSATSQLSLQSYFDRTVLGDLRLSEARNTGDIEIEHRFKLGAAQQIVWGAGYRASYDSIGPSRTISMTPAAQTFQLWNGFAQDTIGLVPNLLSFTFGSKIEHDSYTGFQVEPDARLLWTPTPAQSVWAAVSRAVRTPSRAEEDVSIFEEVAPPNTPGNPSSLPVEVIANGNNALKAESLISYELGYRVQPFSTLSLDLTGFYNDYTNVIGSQLGTSQGPLGTYPDLYLIQPINLVNDGHMRSYGFEMLATWQAAPWWRVQPSYSYLQMQMKVANGDTAEEPVGTSPVSQAGIRSLIDLGSNVTFDGFLRYVDQLPALGVASYVELNARLGWRVSDRLELSLSGENLLHAYHTEFGSETLPIIPTKVPRSVFAKATFKF